MTMSAAGNKDIVRRFFDEAWNRNKLSELGEYISANNVTHPGTLTWPFGPEAAAQLMKVWRTGLPDYQCQIHEMIEEGNTVAARITFWGTHNGRFDVASRTLAPTGRKIFDTEILFFHLSDGKITEIWATWDRLSVLEQLGAIPKPEA
jgi:predicted ester cyclase